MVLINETKYACQSCIKGHRSSSCTHTDRPLFEIKKKGRPATQCSHCRELRKTKQVHVKCMCEAPPAPAPPLSAPVASISPVAARDEPFSGGESSSSAAAAPPSQPKAKTKTKKKDVTLNPPIFPNGLKDYHEMAFAAEALSGLLGGPAVVVKNEKSSVDSLLNPCMCRAGGGCSCCTDKKKPSKKSDGPSTSTSGGAGGCCSSKSTNPAPPLPPSRSTPTYSAYSSTNNSAENLSLPSSSFQLKNPLPASLRNFQPSSSTSGSGTNTPPTSRPLPADELSHIHPAHTSRHVHKTQLYSPYRGGSNGHLPQGNLQPSRSASQSRRSSSAAANAPPQQLAPMKSLTEQMCDFVRVQEQSLMRSNSSGSGDELEGVVATGEGGGGNVMLPPFETFLRGGKDGEGGMMSGCMCGDGCACPNCVQHGNMEVDEEGGEIGEHKDCPPSCSSCFNCTSGFSLPKNVSNIEDLIAACASELPTPPVARQQNSYALDATNLNILPPTAWASKESKEAFGLLEVPKLECCSGRCRCPPGDCSCMKDCCGCCGGCDCEGEGEASKAEPSNAPPIDWTLPPQESSSNEDADGDEPSIPSSCCSGKPPVADASTSNSVQPPPSAPIVNRALAAPASTVLQPQKPSIYKKPAKSDHHRAIGSYEQQPVIKSLSRSNSTASKPHRPQLSKSVSQGVFGNGECVSPTTNGSSIEFQGGSIRRDRSGSSASRSSYQPSPNRSGAATPVSQVSSPHLRPQNHSSDFVSLREDNLRQSSFYPPPLQQHQQPSSSSSSVHHANEELFQLQHNPNLNNLTLNSTPPSSHDQFRSYEEFVAASHLHQHTLMQEQQRLQEEREEQEQERHRLQQQQLQHQQQQQQNQQHHHHQGQESQALEMFLLDAEMEAQLNALLAASSDASNAAQSSMTDFSLGLEDPSASASSASHPQDHSSQQQHRQYIPQQQQSNEDFISAFQPNFDFDPPSPRRGQREFSPMQFDEATGTFGHPEAVDLGVGQDFDFPANAADFLLANFAAPTPAAEEVEEPHHQQDQHLESQQGGGTENVVSPDAFGGLEFDPVSFLQDALGLDASSSSDPHLQGGSSGSSSGDTNGGGTLVDPIFDPFDTGDFDFNSFSKDSLSNWDSHSPSI